MQAMFNLHARPAFSSSSEKLTVNSQPAQKLECLWNLFSSSEVCQVEARNWLGIFLLNNGDFLLPGAHGTPHLTSACSKNSVR